MGFPGQDGIPVDGRCPAQRDGPGPAHAGLIASGYYDPAAPYPADEHAPAGLALDPVSRTDLAVEYDEAGHMMYLRAPSLHKLERDGAAFIERALTK